MAERIVLAKRFSPFPVGRYRWQGRYSGEAFREDVLWPALQQHEEVVVVLDGVSGLSTGFLDEAFAGIVREGYLSEAELWRRLQIVSERDPYIVSEIRSFVHKAATQSAH